MKIKILKTGMMILAVAIITLVGCKKETITPANNTENTEAHTPEMEALMIQVDNEFVNTEVQGGSETEDFYLENNGVPEEYDLQESSADDLDASSVKRGIGVPKMIRCLRDLNLDKEQVAKIRRSLKEYEECKKSIIARHHFAIRQLMEEYNAKLKALKQALANGRITKDQFNAKVKQLREELNKAKKEITMKARLALKDCYTKLLRRLHSILNERQWKAFVNCYRK